MDTKIRKQRRKVIIQLTKQGEEVKEWLSIKRASDELGLSRRNIQHVLRKERPTCGGFKWQYASKDGKEVSND